MADKKTRLAIYASVVDDQTLIDFLKNVRVIRIEGIQRSELINLENEINGSEMDAILFDGLSPKVYGGPDEENVRLYGTRLKIEYQEERNPQSQIVQVKTFWGLRQDENAVKHFEPTVDVIAKVEALRSGIIHQDALELQGSWNYLVNNVWAHIHGGLTNEHKPVFAYITRVFYRQPK